MHLIFTSAFSAAAAEAGKVAEQNKLRYDSKVIHTHLNVVDRILIRNVELQGTHKLADKWAQEVCTVVSMPNSDIPVYREQRINMTVSIKTLHRNIRTCTYF